MALFLLLILTSLCTVGQTALTLGDCGNEARRPAYTDIAVMCGTRHIELAIQICPVIYTGYNASLLRLNHISDDVACQSTLDTTVFPPVARFKFPIRELNACGSNFRTTSAPGTGVFSDFSNIQTVNISGIVRSYDPTTGTITYNAELKYYYSCAYPLEYLINNTRVDVSSSSIALKDQNGSFVSTLRMGLYKDKNYTTPLIIPPLGVELRTDIYVQVIATNMTEQYFVLLDRCYASVSPHPTNSTFFNLFVACSIDPLTTMLENGDSQRARFSFKAFRFIEQQNETVSTYYLHCITRLCERSTCSSFKQCNNGRRRRDTASVLQDGISQPSLLTVAIKANSEDHDPSLKEKTKDQQENQSAAVGLGVAVAVLVVVGVAAMLLAISLYRKLRRLS
ncbi:zona pellucida-like domain-containing protein 1 [Boleophthalmus pectinirostris]|uniref:zona pellucida-like domain-containing protein 1 n=1 Tax=Boleophthalmus pectinirostris TaxID=150288 RepID=UPI00242A7BA0|nr:zona pellucida-like domain-containing protein 1 [Boleophthalmus pectinirostris]